jgi:hypothetical protein
MLLLSQLDLYIKNQKEIADKYNGMIIAVKDGEVQGSFNSKTAAFRAMSAQYPESTQYPEGSFLIIKCTPDDSEYRPLVFTNISF